MDNIKQHLSDISEMRTIMDRSTRFLSLSGLAGIAAGSFALLGAFAAYWRMGSIYSQEAILHSGRRYHMDSLGTDLLIIAVVVLALALGTAIFLTIKKARKHGDVLLSHASKRMLFHMAVPLISGGLFCIVLMYYGLFGLVAPCTLIFYGIACVSGSQHTLTEVKYIGLLNIALGFVNCFFIGYGLLFWAIGFGVLHILYGALMHKRHDRTSSK